MTLLPILLYPVLMLGMTQLIVYQLRKVEKKNVIVAIEGSSLKIEALLAKGSFDVIKSETAWEEVYNEKAVLGLKIPSDFDEKIKTLKKIPRLLIYYSGANEKAQLLLRKLQNTLRIYLFQTKKKILHNQLPGIEQPFVVTTKNIADAKKQGAFQFGRLLALLVVLMAITFPLYPAIDMGAGEKERGTMETLLVSPATRFEIVLGKYLAVFTIAIFGSLLNLTSMGITFGYFTQQSNDLIKATKTQKYIDAKSFEATQRLDNIYSPVIQDNQGKISSAYLFNSELIFTFNKQTKKIALWHIDAEKIIYENSWNFSEIETILAIADGWLIGTQNGRIMKVSIIKNRINLQKLWITKHRIKKILLNKKHEQLFVMTEKEIEVINTNKWTITTKIQSNKNIYDVNANYIILDKDDEIILLNTNTDETHVLKGYRAKFISSTNILVFDEENASIFSTKKKQIIEKINLKPYLYEKVTAISILDEKILIGSSSGVVQLWKYDKQKIKFDRYLGIHRHEIKQLHIKSNNYLSLDNEGIVKKWSVSPLLQFSISGFSLFCMFVLLIPLVAMFSALCLGLSIFARSYKEGQHYLTPMVIIVMPLVMVAFLPNMELSLRFCFVPVSNIVLFYKEMFLGNATFTQGILVFSSTMFYALLSLKWAIHLFKREDVIFRQVDGIHWNFFKPNKEQIFKPQEIVLFFVATLVAFQFISSKLSSNILLAQAFGMILFLVVTPFVLTAALRYNFSKMFSLRYSFPIKKLPTITLIGISALVFSATLAVIQNAILPIHSEQLYEYFTLLIVGKPIWLLLLIFAILPGICEELFFRGFILRNLKCKLGEQKAILWTAFLFAVMHLDISRFFFTFTMGIVLGQLLVRTGNIFVPIFVHILCNSITISVGHYMKPGTHLELLHNFIIENQILTICCAMIVSSILLTKSFSWLGRNNKMCEEK